MECSAIALSGGLQTVYYVSLAVFGLALLVTFGMYLFTNRSGANVTQTLHISMFIFTLQMVLYSIFLGQLGSSFVDDVGSCQPYARWAIYTISCSLLAFEIANLAGMPAAENLGYVLSISVTLATGFLAAFPEDLSSRWILFLLGFAPYVISFTILFRYARWPLIAFVAVFWSLYPLFLILGPLYFDVYSLTVESWLYLAADLVTKVGFEFFVIYQEMQYCEKEGVLMQ